MACGLDWAGLYWGLAGLGLWPGYRPRANIPTKTCGLGSTEGLWAGMGSADESAGWATMAVCGLAWGLVGVPAQPAGLSLWVGGLVLLGRFSVLDWRLVGSNGLGFIGGLLAWI